MTKTDIINYVMYTPYNTNKQILSLMLDALEESISGGNLNSLIDKSVSEIHNDAAAVSESTFENCKNLTIADFPQATIIESYAFNGCENLTNINFPKAVFIGSYAFSETNLQIADFPSVKEIDIYSFYRNTKLTKAIMPQLEKIGSSSFAYSSLNCLILNNSEIVTLSDIGAFAETPIAKGEGYIYVPKLLIDTYKSETNWIAFKDNIRAIEDYSDILSEVS